MSTLHETSSLYDVATTWIGGRDPVEHAGVEAFSSAVAQFLAALGDNQHDEFWAAMTRPLKRVRWRLATIPLPINDPMIGVGELSDELVPELRRCRLYSPSMEEPAEAVARVLLQIRECTDNPLGDAIRLLPEAATVVVLLDGHSAHEVSETVGVKSLTTTQLLRGRARHAVAVGPAAWFPPALMRAPRAQRLTFVYFAWIRDSTPYLGMLAGSSSMLRDVLTKAPPRKVMPKAGPRILTDAPDSASPPADEDPSSWVPVIEWGAVQRVAHRVTHGGHGDVVPAQLFLLASGDGVYLEARDGAQAFVADFDEELIVRQVAVAQLSEGRFLVVRTTGDDNYVRVLADRLLGPRAKHLRDLQQNWKSSLRSDLQRLGAREVSQRLTRLGADRATEENVRRWAAAESIRMRSPADFAAVCELIGESRVTHIWSALGVIRKAHMDAGNEVRRLLIDEIRKADGTALLQRGWADYDVAEIEGEGTLRVARVTGRAPQAVDVPHSRLRKLFQVGDQLWLG